MPNILPLIQDLVKLYSNITAPPTTPPPSPPPSTQPGTEPRMGYDDPFFRPSPPAYWHHPYPYYPPFSRYGYGAWQPPFGPPATYVMPPVWPWGGGYASPYPYYPPSSGTSRPTATTVYIVPANMLGNPSYYERGHERTTMGDDGREQQWWWDPRYGDILKRLHGQKAAEDLQRYGVVMRPSPWDLALAIQGYPLNEAAREQYRQYVDQFMQERYHNYDLRKALEIAKNPPQWQVELWQKYGGEPEWHKEIRRLKVETLPTFIEKYQPEPLQRSASQTSQTQPPTPPEQIPHYGYGGREM